MLQYRHCKINYVLKVNFNYEESNYHFQTTITQNVNHKGTIYDDNFITTFHIPHSDYHKTKCLSLRD